LADDLYADARVCETCRVLVVPVAGRWVHPEDLREKFRNVICAAPVPGRSARAPEIRFGRGRNVARDKDAIHDGIHELHQPPGTPVTVGVDGSYKLTIDEVEESVRVLKPMSWGYLTTSGLYGLGTATIAGNIVGGDRALQGELRAIWNALGHIDDSHPVTLITDSMDAIELMAQWRDGYLNQMPRGYTTERISGRPATLVQLAAKVHEAGDRIEARWVRGHTGHPLNEGADALAKLARAWTTKRIRRAQAAADARQVALAALLRHAAELRA
jgi:ribonuclease HI